MNKIMIIDDDNLVGVSLESFFNIEGYQAFICESGKQGIEMFKQFLPDIVFLDIRLGDMDGLEVLRQIKQMREDIPVIMLTAYGTIENTVQAMHEGAFDYIQKPFDNQKLKAVVKKGLKNKEKIKNLINRRLPYLRKHGITEIIGRSPEIKRVFELVGRFAKSDDATILIEGESGVGKEVVAEYIHFLSPHFGKPFIKLNCGSITNSIAESELFGYEKGTFTGGLANGKPGKFQMAEQGTLFLDEIGDLSYTVQTKLLRVLEEKTYFRVGGTREIKCNVRVILATNKNLLSEVRNGRFREDLYFRVSGLKIFVPPLRDRKQDIIPLAEFFLHQFSQKYHRHPAEFLPETKEVLKNHQWKGNIRELRNAMERVILMEKTRRIRPEHLQFLINKIETSETILDITNKDIFINGITYDEMVKKLISAALREIKGNQVKAAKLLGITRAKLRYMIKKYSIT